MSDDSSGDPIVVCLVILLVDMTVIIFSKK